MKTHQNEQKVIKLRYSKKKKKKGTNENVSTSKENKDKVINNKGNKDNAVNSKADDKISKNRETVERPFFESDTDQSDSPKKKEN